MFKMSSFAMVARTSDRNVLQQYLDNMLPPSQPYTPDLSLIVETPTTIGPFCRIQGQVCLEVQVGGSMGNNAGNIRRGTF
jgi:hypothetical protein